jgi:hypothetical protein
MGGERSSGAKAPAPPKVGFGTAEAVPFQEHKIAMCFCKRLDPGLKPFSVLRFDAGLKPSSPTGAAGAAYPDFRNQFSESEVWSEDQAQDPSRQKKGAQDDITTERTSGAKAQFI